MTHFQWNYTTFLNIVFLGILAVLYWLHRDRDRFGGGQGYAFDPVCGMQVQTAHAPASATHDGRTLFFCSDRCRERFDADPPRFGATPSTMTTHDHDAGTSEPIADGDGHEASVIDPVCGMAIDPTTATSHRHYERREYHFCGLGCASAFDADPRRFVGPPAEQHS
jgi:YHS domain-containing protein